MKKSIRSLCALMASILLLTGIPAFAEVLPGNGQPETGIRTEGFLEDSGAGESNLSDATETSGQVPEADQDTTNTASEANQGTADPVSEVNQDTTNDALEEVTSPAFDETSKVETQGDGAENDEIKGAETENEKIKESEAAEKEETEVKSSEMFTVTVEGGFITAVNDTTLTASVTSGTYVTGTKLEITYNDDSDYEENGWQYKFGGWNVNAEKEDYNNPARVENVEQKVTQFTVGKSDAVISAAYTKYSGEQKVYALGLRGDASVIAVNGQAMPQVSSKERSYYPAGTVLTLSAPEEANIGYNIAVKAVFSQWMCDDIRNAEFMQGLPAEFYLQRLSDRYAPVTDFIMPACDVVLEPTYRNAEGYVYIYANGKVTTASGKAIDNGPIGEEFIITADKTSETDGIEYVFDHWEAEVTQQVGNAIPLYPYKELELENPYEPTIRFKYDEAFNKKYSTIPAGEGGRLEVSFEAKYRTVIDQEDKVLTGIGYGRILTVNGQPYEAGKYAYRSNDGVYAYDYFNPGDVIEIIRDDENGERYWYAGGILIENSKNAQTVVEIPDTMDDVVISNQEVIPDGFGQQMLRLKVHNGVAEKCGGEVYENGTDALNYVDEQAYKVQITLRATGTSRKAPEGYEYKFDHWSDGGRGIFSNPSGEITQYVPTKAGLFDNEVYAVYKLYPVEAKAEGSVSVIPDIQTDGVMAEISAEQVADAVMTEADRAALADGEDIRIWVNVTNADPLDDREKELVMSCARSFIYGKAVDIRIMKQTGDGEKISVTKTEKPLQIMIHVPEELQASGRTYAVVRLHNDAAAIVGTGKETGIDISSDEFSVYAVVYKDTTDESDETEQQADTDESSETNQTGKPAVESQDTSVNTKPDERKPGNTQSGKTENPDQTPKTGDTAPVGLMALSMILAALLFAAGIAFRKKINR